MAHKDELFEHYRAEEAWWKTQKNVKIKCLRSDRGGEYKSKEFDAHLAVQGTIRRLTVHHTPEYNGVSERLNRTLLNKVRAMLHDSGLPKFLWGEALMYAVYLKNCMHKVKRSGTKLKPSPVRRQRGLEGR
jgi:transposase InsO family protein